MLTFSKFGSPLSLIAALASLALVACGACGGSGGSSTDPSTSPPDGPASTAPNIVLIIADDLGIGDVGVYGSTLVKTPNIDMLAEQGVMLTDAHASASVCTPSRYAIHSGRYYYRYSNEQGNWQGENMLGLGQPTLASVLRDSGYATALFGKWHQGWGYRAGRRFREDIDWNSTLTSGVLEAGFDTYFGTPYSHNEPPFVFVRDRQVVALDPADPLSIITGNTNLGPYGWGYSEGASAAHKARPVADIDVLVAAEAIDFIETHRSAPFYLQLALVAPHTPQVPSAKFKGASGLGTYGDVVLQLDWIVGEVMKTLKQQGIENNTLVIFTSDNGAIIASSMLDRGHLSNLEWLGQKTDVWEGGTRVPFIARWPGKIAAGSVADSLFGLVDLAPTIWAALGVSPPAMLLDGSDQWPLLSGDTRGTRRYELVMQGSRGKALRQDQWVYIGGVSSMGVTTDPSATWALGLAALGQSNSDYDAQGKLKPDAPSAQLYNLQDDPGQAQNVIRQYPEIAAAMAQRLRELVQ